MAVAGGAADAGRGLVGHRHPGRAGCRDDAAGIAGGGVTSVVAALAGELADRLACQELAARNTLRAARQQARLNRLMIEDPGRGDGRRSPRAVQAANPAALQLIGCRRAGASEGLRTRPVAELEPLQQALARPSPRRALPEAGELSLRLPARAATSAIRRSGRCACARSSPGAGTVRARRCACSS